MITDTREKHSQNEQERVKAWDYKFISLVLAPKMGANSALLIKAI